MDDGGWGGKAIAAAGSSLLGLFTSCATFDSTKKRAMRISGKNGDGENRGCDRMRNAGSRHRASAPAESKIGLRQNNTAV
eukprot:scaffold13647_cov112-Isochrysis_galbana.AAC.5